MKTVKEPVKISNDFITLLFEHINQMEIEKPHENRREDADNAVEAESSSSQEGLPKIRQLIEKINTMSVVEVQGLLKTLTYEEIIVLTTLGSMAEEQEKELESKFRTRPIPRYNFTLK